MNRFIFRHLVVFLFAFAGPVVLAGTIRTVDFESPTPFAEPWHHDWEAYYGYEAVFEYGIRKAPIDGLTTSTMYWGGPGACGNCDYGPVRVFFSKPVKNIHFTLFNLFSFYEGPIHWDTREFFTGPATFGMNITPLMDSTQSRSITIPAEHVRYLDIATGHDIALDDFSFEVEDDTQTSVSYRLDLNLTTDPSQFDQNAHTISPGADINAELALGTVFSIGVSKRTPNPSGPATITSIDSAYTRFGETVAPALQTKINLFRDRPVVQLDADPTGAALHQTYVAVHLGTVKFTLTPLQVGGPGPVTLNLAIVRPTSLLGGHNEWDDRIVDAAHERGIPPQILKGQIEQESPKFAKDELRYEPCSVDWAHVSAGLINKLPYSLYAMDALRSDAEHDSTVDLRNIYLIADRPGGVYDPSLTRYLAHSDATVTIREIWDANDGPLSQQGYDLGASDQNWAIPDPTVPAPPGDPFVVTTCGLLNQYLQNHTYPQYLQLIHGITAQTPTASSYGVMQVLYSTAVDYPIRWYVPNPNQNIPGCPTTSDKCQSPRYLRDTSESLALPRGGSLFAGGHRDVQMYEQWGPGKAYVYESQDDFFDSFEEPLQRYNGTFPNYGANIIDDHEFNHLPVQPSPIFQ